MNSNEDIQDSFSSLSINNSRNQILWDKEKLTGLVKAPKGNIWNTIGVFQSGQAFVYADEALFLAENHGFDIFDISSSNKFNSIVEMMSVIRKDCGFMSFKLFNILKKQGYILMRPECKYFPKFRLFETLRGEYSLFKPSSTFKKTSPSGFIGHVLEIKQDDDIKSILERLEKLEKISCSAIMAVSDETNGFLFLETSLVCPFPSQFESNNTQSKLPRYPKSIAK